MKLLIQQYGRSVETEELSMMDISYGKGLTEDEDWSLRVTPRGSGNSDMLPMKREVLIQMLKRMDEEYVEIYYHKDHRQYELYPCDFRVADKEDYEMENKERKERASKYLANYAKVIKDSLSSRELSLEELIKHLNKS